MRRQLAALLLTTLLLAVPLAVAEKGRGRSGDDDSPSDFAKRGDRWVLHNDKVAVWFHQNPAGKAKPDLVVLMNGTEDERAGYRVKVLRLCEVDEEARCTGKYPRINLEKAREWNVVQERVNATLTLTMVTATSQGIVKLVWHVDGDKASVKYDLYVENWKWQNASHKLMLDMLVLGKNLRNATGASVDVQDAGYVKWATTALVTRGNATETIPVTSMVKPLRHDAEEDEEDEDERREASGGHVYLLFNATGGYSKLDYDPEFGVASSSVRGVSPVPALGLAVGVAVLAVAAVALRRRT